MRPLKYCKHVDMAVWEDEQYLSKAKKLMEMLETIAKQRNLIGNEQSVKDFDEVQWMKVGLDAHAALVSQLPLNGNKGKSGTDVGLGRLINLMPKLNTNSNQE
jgi:hypothetical protein